MSKQQKIRASNEGSHALRWNGFDEKTFQRDCHFTQEVRPIETRQGRKFSVTKIPSHAEEAMSTGWHMGDYYSGKDPWAHVVKTLGADADWAKQPTSFVKIERIGSPISGSRSGTRLSVTGALNDHSLTVMWRNPTVGQYGEQHWIATLARAKGVCELSGDAIHRGDAVFRPRSSSPPPLNSKAMILARHLAQAAMHSSSLSIEQSSAASNIRGSFNVGESAN